jgi:hypothetical protein
MDTIMLEEASVQKETWGEQLHRIEEATVNEQGLKNIGRPILRSTIRVHFKIWL